MPFATTRDNVRLHYEEAGSGTPLLFVHEFAGDWRAWEPQLRNAARATAAEYDKVGSQGVAKTYGMGPSRIPFEVKDPRGYREFYDQFASHSAKGAANTLRGYQAGRPPVYEFEAELRQLALPTLIVCGDEDDACIEPSVYLKKHIATSGLAIFPKSGHTVNIEEPALFNQTLGDFLSTVDAGRWGARDKRSIRAAGRL